MDVIKKIREALEEGAEALDPVKADPRAVVPDVTGVPHSVAPRRAGRKPAPGSVEVRPSQKDLGKEHRGY